MHDGLCQHGYYIEDGTGANPLICAELEADDAYLAHDYPKDTITVTVVRYDDAPAAYRWFAYFGDFDDPEGQHGFGSTAREARENLLEAYG